MQQFVADGTWAYTLIFIVMLVNMMMYKYIHSTITGICYTYVNLVHILCRSQLTLILDGCSWSSHSRFVRRLVALSDIC